MLWDSNMPAKPTFTTLCSCLLFQWLKILFAFTTVVDLSTNNQESALDYSIVPSYVLTFTLQRRLHMTSYPVPLASCLPWRPIKCRRQLHKLNRTSFSSRIVSSSKNRKCWEYYASFRFYKTKTNIWTRNSQIQLSYVHRLWSWLVYHYITII